MTRRRSATGHDRRASGGSADAAVAGPAGGRVDQSRASVTRRRSCSRSCAALPDQLRHRSALGRAPSGRSAWPPSLLGDAEVAGRVYELLRDHGRTATTATDPASSSPADRWPGRCADFALAAGRIEDAVELLCRRRHRQRPDRRAAVRGALPAGLGERSARPLAGSGAPVLAWPIWRPRRRWRARPRPSSAGWTCPALPRPADRLLVELAAAVRSDNPLTARENEVVALLAKGRRNKEIAADAVPVGAHRRVARAQRPGQARPGEPRGGRRLAGGAQPRHAGSALT